MTTPPGGQHPQSPHQPPQTPQPPHQQQAPPQYQPQHQQPPPYQQPYQHAQPPQHPQQRPGQQFPPPGPGGRPALPWIIAGVAVVVAAVVVAVVVTLALTRDGDNSASGGNGGDESGSSVDVKPPGGGGGSGGAGSPEDAASALIAAVEAGDVAEVWELTCYAHKDCVEATGEDLTERELAEMRPKSAADMSEFAGLIEGAEVAGSGEESSRTPGAMGVPLRTSQGEATLLFLESGGRWYYIGAEGSSGGSGGGGGGAPGGN
jgi:hypothetical protein